MTQSIEALTLQLRKQERLHHLLSTLLNRFLTTEMDSFQDRVDTSLAELGHYFKGRPRLRVRLRLSEPSVSQHVRMVCTGCDGGN